MPTEPTDTIFACATGLGPSAIAIVRISGPKALDALRALGGKVGTPRRLMTTELRSLDGKISLDAALSAHFPGPHSYTGETIVELHLHGGRSVLSGILAELSRIRGLRPAEAGEFTRRAFENGKIDLTEAEAIGDLIAADTSAQQRQALRQLSGEFGRLCESWRARLLRALAHLEAFIDFPDEDLPAELEGEIAAAVQQLADEIQQHLQDDRRGERLRNGFHIAIIGPPNAGKSSLLNALARRDVAITAETAGTTRDVVEVQLDLGGFPVTVADTAGLREAADAIEAEGVRRALARAGEADLRLIVLDAADPNSWKGMPGDATACLIDANAIVVLNKVDLVGRHLPTIGIEMQPHNLSVRSGEGFSELLQKLTAEIAARMPGEDAGPLITRARHRAALEECLVALRRHDIDKLPELAAEDLRLAARALGRITGRVDVEDLLDLIFREFCIGK